tara:strand:+ start:436 stop:666 length:231 start_codon:yes stop_codon:yes gene_type:complete
MNKKAISHSAKIIFISAAIGFATKVIFSSFMQYPNLNARENRIGFGIFLLSAIILHIKPELMGKLYKADETNEDQS